MGKPLEFEIVADAGSERCTLSVSGEIDIYSADTLRQALRTCLDRGARTVVVDMAALEFIDSTGVSALIGGYKQLQNDGCELVVRSAPDAIRRTLEITGVHKWIRLVD
jgi:anti-anti-sigma factor